MPVKNGSTMGSRFWAKVAKTDTCWNWTASKANGYGKFAFWGDGRIMGAHKASWLMHNGPILDGLFVLHKCDNPACVRPDHLFLGTHTENMRDCMAKGRFKSGPNLNTHCKRGHPLSGDNLYMFRGKRNCKECRKQTRDRYFAKSKMNRCCQPSEL